MRFRIVSLTLLILYSVIININRTEKVFAIIPYYNLPSKENLKKESFNLGKSAYQLLYFGQLKESLKMAELAISLNDNDEKLWAILAEVQIANKLYEKALISLNKAKKLNPNIGEIYFAESSIYLKKNEISKAKLSLLKGLKLEPKNYTALFQLGNIFLMEKEYEKALESFNLALKINPKFWQAINNKGLVYFELNEKTLAISSFKEAISINNNAESLLALSVTLHNQGKNDFIKLAKEALLKNPNYVSTKYRKEQLWGEKLQNATKELFRIKELKAEIELAKKYLN